MRRFITKITGALALLCSGAGAAFPGQPASAPDGKAIFETKCARCHGNDGTKGLLGARNLQTSQLPDAELLQVVTKGRRIMPAWGNRLSNGELQQVVQYVKQLRH